MKKSNLKVHIVYWLFIGMMAVGLTAVVVTMRNGQKKLTAEMEAEDTLDRAQLVGSIGQAEEALRTAAYSENPTVYAGKMQILAESSAAASLLTEQRDPASVWMMLWKKLSDFAGEEIAGALGQSTVSPDSARLAAYADLLAKLKESPDALDGELWDLPEGLAPPKLQTEFSLGEEQLREKAARLLSVGGGLLKKADAGMPGIARYRCSNAEIDLLVSGALVYLDLQLERGEGSIGREEGLERLRTFAGQEGYPSTQVTDLYEEEGILWAKMAETVVMPPYGRIKNLDRSLLAACTLWSGRVCHFEVLAADRTALHPESNAGGGVAAVGLLSEAKLKKLAGARNAQLGEAVICRGRLCRTLILEQGNPEGAICLYLDAIDGIERAIERRTVPHTDELPASAEFGSRKGERAMPSVCDALPPYGEWQRRRFGCARAASQPN